MALCYPPSTMAETKLTKKEIADLRIRLEEERIQLDGQLTTIEEDSFASTQSDASGDVGLDDEPADAGLRHPEPFRQRPDGLLRGATSLGSGSDPDDDALGSALDGRPTGSGGHTHRDGRHVEV